jgi:hypothetical protein
MTYPIMEKAAPYEWRHVGLTSTSRERTASINRGTTGGRYD